MILVSEIPKIGLMDLPTHALQVRALISRSGVTTWEVFAKYLGYDTPPSEPLIVVGDMCAMMCAPGGRPTTLLRLVELADRQKTPPVSRMAGNLAAAIGAVAKNIVKGQPVKVSQEEARARLDICKTCPHIQGNRCMDIQLADGTVEKGCGCNLSVKAEYADMVCPQDKWKK